jgi:hypothetical protein
MTFSFKNMKRSHVAKFGEYGGRSNSYICRGGGQVLYGKTKRHDAKSFCDITPRMLAEVDRRFRGAAASIIRVLYLRRLSSSYSPL